MMPRGGYVHNRVLVDPIERRAAELGLATAREVFVVIGRRAGHAGPATGYADLVINGPGWRLVVEAELTTRRVHLDLAKAAALQATELWIVAPTSGGAVRVRSSLRRLGVRPDAGACVLLLSQALQRLARRAELFSPPNDHQEKKTNAPEVQP
ncbi:MAG: hypothetical protein IT436_16030 [Phycisphaerales bacterium]|nr:hypothetical protein [Phycisphaerales bacterium]